MLTFTVPGEPVGWARARLGGKTHFTDPQTRSEKATVAWWAKQAGAQVADGAVVLTMRAYLGIPKSASKKRRAAMLTGEEYPTKKPDSDNLAKLTMDALRSVCWRDDVQVVDLIVMKRWSDQPRLEIEIRPLAGVNQQSDGSLRNKAA